MTRIASQLYRARRNLDYSIKLVDEVAKQLKHDDLALDEAIGCGKAMRRWLDEGIENAEEGVYDREN